jgi:carbamoyl-phosphate synthase small subunit
MNTESPQLTLTLEDGTTFTGRSFGAHTDAVGEVVFNTGMVGYPESFTDPSYTGQILVLTYPLIGNYGVPNDQTDEHALEKFFESAGGIKITAVVVSEYSETNNHWQAVQSLSDWLKKYNVPGITGIDTRALTQKIREKGAMLGTISTDPKKKVDFKDPNEENLVAQVSIKAPKTYPGGDKHIAIVDCGMKLNIIRSFLDRGLTVTRVPWNHNLWDMGIDFDGVFFSNGPGDPKTVPETVELMKQCFERKIPTFGICLGSQIMGLAAGGKTYKLKFGHRSQNQPCVDTETGRCYITSQNHGYAVKADSLPKDWDIWLTNANDGTVEGIRHKKLPFFSVQFHPESTPGPTDTNHLFDEFIAML